MKKTLSALVAAALLAGCGETIHFTLTGSDPTFVDGKYMYVITFAGGRESVVDSALIRNAAFTMQGSWPYPVSAYLYMGRGADGEQIGDMHFILESGEIRVEKREKGFAMVGTPQNELTNDLQRRIADLKGSDLPSLHIDKTCEDLLRTVAMENRNAVGICLLEDLLRTRPGREVAQLAKCFPLSFRRHPALKELRQRIAGMQTDIGRAYINIEGQTPDGGCALLSDVLTRPGNRYVLLDFGAFWCGPCREEFRKLATVYEMFHHRGFDIFGVSFDVDRRRWLECIETYGMNWTQIHPGFGIPPRETKVWQDYSLYGIPASYLIDCTTMVVIAKNLRSEALAEKLYRLLD